nr:hypothetical protein [Tanacetum cinerariifolium]
MRLQTDIKLKEATFQVVLDALALTPFYQAFLITVKAPAIYMQEFWAIVSIHKSNIRFKINKMKFSLDVEIFRDILQIFPKIPRQKFEDLPLEHDILSFIRDLGNSGDIIYITDIENKDAKKTNKMSYPRFTKIIIDYFISKDQSVLRRNKMFWHTAQDDTMFTSIRCISRHEKTQVYGAILPKDLTNQTMLESKAYKTFYAFASREKTPKPKYVRKKADPDTSPKQKHVQATKGTRIKTKAKVARFDKKKQPTKMPKAKGLDVLSKVALTEAGYQKKQERLSHITCKWLSCEQDDDEDDFEDNADNNDDDNNKSDDDRTESERDDIHDPNRTNEEHDEEEEYDDEFNIKEDENMDEEENDEVIKELYKDVNVNLGNKDADMADVDQSGEDQQNASQQSGFEQEEEDVHVTLTPILKTQKTRGITQSFFVSSDFTSKLLNLDNLSLEEAQAEKREYIELVDSTVRTIIKEEVNTQLPQILPQAILDVATPVIEKNVIESIEAAVLTRDKKDKDRDPSIGSDRRTKRRKSSKDVESFRDSRSKEKKSLSTSKDASQSQHKSFGKSAYVEEPSHTVEDSGMQQV